MVLPNSNNLLLFIDNQEVYNVANAAAEQLNAPSQRITHLDRLVEERPKLKVPKCIVMEDREEFIAMKDYARKSIWPAPVIVLSRRIQNRFLLQNGIFAVLLEPFNVELVCSTIVSGLSFASYISNVLGKKQRAVELIQSLSPTHAHVARELIANKPHKIIAKQLGISVRTVDSRKKEIFALLNIDSVCQLVRLIDLANGLPFDLDLFQWDWKSPHLH